MAKKKTVTQVEEAIEDELAVRADEQVLIIPTAKVRPGKLEDGEIGNDRKEFDVDALRELGEDIKANSQTQPCIVRRIAAEGEVEYELIAGERRWRACSMVNIPIRAIVRQLTDEQIAAQMLSENLHRLDLTPLEESEAYHKRMVRFGWDESKCAKAAGKSTAHVKARLGLLGLIDDIKALMASKVLALSYAELMVAAQLDANSQRAALKYLTNTDKPSIYEFTALCGKLSAAQSQMGFFDEAQAIGVIKDAVQEHRQVLFTGSRQMWPMRADLPPVARDKAMGLAIENYMQTLIAEGHRDEASVIGWMYYGLIQQGVIFPPLKSKLRDAHKAALESEAWTINGQAMGFTRPEGLTLVALTYGLLSSRANDIGELRDETLAALSTETGVAVEQLRPVFTACAIVQAAPDDLLNVNLPEAQAVLALAAHALAQDEAARSGPHADLWAKIVNKG